MEEILNQLLNDVEKHGVTLVRDHLNYYIKQLKATETESILKDYPQSQNQPYFPLIGKTTKIY